MIYNSVTALYDVQPQPNLLPVTQTSAISYIHTHCRWYHHIVDPNHANTINVYLNRLRHKLYDLCIFTYPDVRRKSKTRAIKHILSESAAIITLKLCHRPSPESRPTLTLIGWAACFLHWLLWQSTMNGAFLHYVKLTIHTTNLQYIYKTVRYTNTLV